MRVVDDIDHAEEDIIAAARSGLAQLHAVTWKRVRDEPFRDIHMLPLMNMAENGFPDTPQRMSPQLLGFCRFRDSLSAIDGVVTYGNRTVIPPSLRSEVCQHLHSAHQGVTQMMSRATASISRRFVNSVAHVTPYHPANRIYQPLSHLLRCYPSRQLQPIISMCGERFIS